MGVAPHRPMEGAWRGQTQVHELAGRACARTCTLSARHGSSLHIVLSPLVSLSQLPGAGSKPMGPLLSYSATSSVRSRAEVSWRGAVPLASLA